MLCPLSYKPKTTISSYFFCKSYSKNCNVNKLITRIGTVEGYLSTKTLFRNKEIYSDSKIIKSAYDILYNHIEPRKILEGLYN